MTTTDQTSTRDSGIVNGIDTTALSGFSAAVAGDPAVGDVAFTVDTHWQGGTRSRASVTSYHLSGHDYPRQFTIDADEPAELLGTDTAPNPQELLLAALNACMTVGIVATTAARGIDLTSLRIRTTGRLDLRGFLGLDPAVNPGYDRVDVHIDATSDALDADLRAALHDALTTSPNLNNFRRAISIDPTISTRTHPQ